jgi:hypothetical protein
VRKPSDKKMRAAAKTQYHTDGEIEIDDDAEISRSERNEDGGAYVAAWVWVRDEDADDKDFADTLYKRRMGLR